MFRIGIDLGGTNIVSAVVDENYNIISKGKKKTYNERPASQIFDDIAESVRIAVKNADITLNEVKSIGIGTPGSVNKAKGVIDYANNLGFDKVPAYQMLSERLGFDKIFIDNDANCAALGEAVAGAGKGSKDFIAITLGTGIGSGIVSNGKLVTGVNYAGAEMGHTVIIAGGEPCTCGRRGCWEAYASATALIRDTKKAMKENPFTIMWDMVDNNIDDVNGKTAFDAMRAGDPVATAVCQKYIYYLSVGTINIVNIFQPEKICFGGGIGHEGENILAPLRKIVASERYSRHSEKQTIICEAELGNDAGIIGAALLDE